MMRRILFILFLTIPFLGFGQSMDIRWNESGIEFSINTHTGELDYSVPGGSIKYNGTYDVGPKGSVKSIGSVSIKYNGTYDVGPKGSVKSVGSVSIKYNGTYDVGPKGSVKSVGRLSVKYNGTYDVGPKGSVKSTSGSVR